MLTDYEAKAREKARAKAEKVEAKPAVEVASDEIKTKEPAKKDINGYKKHADNDGRFHLRELDDGTNVEPGTRMENEIREPAHQQHELAIEEDAPGFEQAAALMTPRGNVHYDQGGSIDEVNAGKAAGEA